ncbi:MAG: YfiT family bacillithiol transferase [Bacteroidota bacterium]
MSDVSTPSLEQLKYPIGHYEPPAQRDVAAIRQLIEAIEALPSELEKAVLGMSKWQLDTPYRPEGWTVRQVVHHLADSHMNSLIRFKLALTEENPTIKPYFEDRWAKLEDSMEAPISISLNLIKPLHQRWGIVLRSMSTDDFTKTFLHPETQKTYDLFYALGMYAWHGRHHTAQVTGLKKRMAW